MDKVLLKYTEYDQPHESQTNNDIVETIHRLIILIIEKYTISGIFILVSLSGRVLLDLTVLTSMIPILETSEMTAVHGWAWTQEIRTITVFSINTATISIFRSHHHCKILG